MGRANLPKTDISPTGKPGPKANGNWLAFAAVSIGSFLGPLSGSIVIVAMPSMSHYYNVDMQSIKWVVMIYLAVGTMLLPLVGVLGRRFGPSRLFIGGFSLFALGAVLSALSPASLGLPWLLGARLLQSVGAAALFGVSMALVTRTAPSNRRGLAFGIIGSVVSVALIIGNPLGVIICYSLDWHWVFWVQVPVALAGMVLGMLMLPPDVPDHSTKIAGWNFIAWFLMIGALILLAEAYSKGLWVEYVPLTTTAALACMAVFGVLEHRGPRLIEYSLFRFSAYWRGTLGAFLAYLTMYSLILLLPFYLEEFLDLPTGLIMLFFALSPITTVFSGPLAGHIADKIGYRIPVISGLSITTVSYVLIGAAVATHSMVLLGVSLALLGIGNGLFGSVNYNAMMSCATDSQRSHAASFCSLTRNLGFLVGTSLGSLLFGLFLLMEGGHALMEAARTHQIIEAVSPSEFFYALEGVVWVSAVLVFIALLITLPYPNHPEVETE